MKDKAEKNCHCLILGFYNYVSIMPNYLSKVVGMIEIMN